MAQKDELGVPISRPGSWKWVYVAFATLGIVGVTLSALYRVKPKETEVMDRARRKAARAVTYTVVFSAIPPTDAERIATRIVADIGVDSATTDMVVGSSVADPWCASTAEYRRQVVKGLTESPNLVVGKQTQILSMITGLLTKNALPATIYLCGTLNTADIGPIVRRTKASADAMRVRNDVMGPVRIVNLLQPADAPIHMRYADIFERSGITVQR